MKARDYFEKYKEQFFGPLSNEKMSVVNVKKLFCEFNDETVVIIASRNAVKGSAVASIILEQNQKWNSLVRLFEHYNNISPINLNGYKNAWELEMPELKEYTKKKVR